MQVVVDGLLVHYHCLGDKAESRPVVVVLHGWADSSASWIDFGERLMANYNVLLVDLPGFGGSERPAAAWGLDEYASFVGSMLAKLTVKPYAVVGHSNGGAIAVRGLATGALAADRLVLLASAGIRSAGQTRTQAWRLVAKTGKLLAAPLPVATKRRLRRRLYAAAGSDMLIVEHLQASFKRVVSHDIRAEAGQLDLPVLLVYGEADTETPPAFGRLLHEHMRQSTLKTIGRAGHFLQRDRPAEVARLVREFLA